MNTMTRFFDVHIWPTEGRILLINADPGSAYGPLGMVVTEVTIRSLIDGYTDPSAVVVLASTMIAGAHVSACIEHDAEGRMWHMDPVNFARTPL